MLTLGVALAAGVGAVLRHLLDQAVQRQRRLRGPFPWGTLAVNLTGSLLLGVVVGLADRGVLPPDATLVLSVGLAGGYTTLSTWAWETLALVRDDAARAAWLNALGTLVLCLAAAGAGLALASL